jgi:biotin operon repressor
MLYKRLHEIERRLNEILKLVAQGRQSTPTLAKALNISQPTVSRCLTALRERGYSIQAVKRGNYWSYELVGEPVSAPRKNEGRE